MKFQKKGKRMVYTKHFNIRSENNLRIAKRYIENAEKTLVSSVDSHLEQLFPYVTNDDKTISKQLVSGHHIVNVYNATEEFYATKEMALRRRGTKLEFDPTTGKMILNKKTIEEDRRGGKAILAHHLIQSFSPDDNLTPEQIHEIGRKVMDEFTGGEYEYIIATHIDKNHIHNHIIMNSTNFMTGREYPWKVIQLQNGEYKNVSKENFEKISDKLASKVGAKIIEKEPKLTRKKYTQWQVENIYKSKIKKRIDFLLEHSNDLEDFIKKAEALDLKVDFKQKHSRFKLLDEPQTRFTRGRILDKNHPEKYSKQYIEERLKENDLNYSIAAVQDLYKENIQVKTDSYDYQIKINEWQISHKTEKGYYIDLDFGVHNRGQVYVPAFKIDPVAEGYYLYLKKTDFFYYTSNHQEQQNKYIPADTLKKQLIINNGSKALYREPVIERLNDIVDAINFLAKNEVYDSNQLENLERKLQATSEEAYNTLKQLDSKIGDLMNVAKELLMSEENRVEIENIQNLLVENGLGKNTTYDDLIEKIESYQETRDLLHVEFEATLKDIEKYKKIKYVSHQYESEENKNRPSL